MAVTTDRLLAVLTGAIGDLLAAQGNGLHEPMAVVVRGDAVALQPQTLTAAFPGASDHIVVLVHGLMGTVDDFEFARTHASEPEGYGTALQTAWGWTPVYVRYNSGLPLPDNGAALAALLGELVDAWPVPIREVALVGHSMGGLVVRHALGSGSAGAAPWRGLVRRVAFLGSPHGGAPMERGGRLAAGLAGQLPDPVAKVIAEVANLRSAGIVGLGRPELPQLDASRQYLLVAGRLWSEGGVADWLGDGMVPVPSATAAEEALPSTAEIQVIQGANHAEMAHHPQVGKMLVQFLETDALAAHAQATPPVTPAARSSHKRRWVGLGHLALLSAGAANQAVARVRLARAEQVFAALANVPALSQAVTLSRSVHGAVVVAGHAPVALAVAAIQTAAAAAEALTRPSLGAESSAAQAASLAPDGMAASGSSLDEPSSPASSP